MLSKSDIKLVQSLKLKKFRQKYNLFVAEGDKTICTLLKHNRISLYKLFAMSSWIEDSDIRVNPRLVNICDKKELKKLSSLRTLSFVVGLFSINDDNDEHDKSYDREIYLDDIQDPGNVGTIIRIADWYGVKRVVRSEGSADFYNPKVIQATMGSIGHVSTMTLPKTDFAEMYEDHLKIGASMTSKGTIITHSKMCMVVGNEGHGISPIINKALDVHCHIAGAEGRQADSLNVAIATGLLCQMLF